MHWTIVLHAGAEFNLAAGSAMPSVAGPVAPSIIGPTLSSIIGPTLSSIARSTLGSIVGPTPPVVELAVSGAVQLFGGYAHLKSLRVAQSRGLRISGARTRVAVLPTSIAFMDAFASTRDNREVTKRCISHAEPVGADVVCPSQY